jgi:hypothetical protein
MGSGSSAYAPNGIWQCLLKSSAVPVMIVRGLKVFDTPLDGGNALIHRTTFAIISIIIRPGIILKGNVLLRARALSLSTLICRSTSGTCSLAAVVLRLIPCASSSSRMHSNSRSIKAVLGLKPRVLYKDTILINDLTRLVCDRLGTYYVVVNFIFRDIVTTKGSPFTNITSAAIVTALFMSRISFGIST